MQTRAMILTFLHVPYDSNQDLRLDVRPDFAFKQCIDRRAEMPLSLQGMPLPARETAILEFTP